MCIQCFNLYVTIWIEVVVFNIMLYQYMGCAEECRTFEFYYSYPSVSGNKLHCIISIGNQIPKSKGHLKSYRKTVMFYKYLNNRCCCLESGLEQACHIRIRTMHS